MKYILEKLACAALLAVMLVAPAAAQVPAPLDPPEKVKVAYVPIMKFATMYVAAQRGLFEKYGLEVELERVKSGTEAIAFLTQGSVDVGGIAIVTSLWNGWSRGLDLRIIAPGALEPIEGGTTGIYVRKDLYDSGEITSAADLEGRRLASAGGPGSGGEYISSVALRRGNLTIRDVEMINMSNADMPAAIEAGSVDAVMTGSPYSDQMQQAGTAVMLERDLIPGLMTVAFVGSGKFVNQRPEVARRFVLALTEASRMMQGDDYLAPENIEAYLSYTNSTEDIIRSGKPVVYDPNMVIPVEKLSDIEDIHRTNGRTEYDTPIDMSNVVDGSFVEQAIEVVGPYKGI